MPAASPASDKPYGGKICEGFEGAFFPEMGYVVQGSKVWFSFGKESTEGKSLTESLADHATIVESFDDLILAEDDKGQKYAKDGVWYVEGVFQRSDVVNANKRVYGRKIWERLVGNPKSNVMETVKARGMLGHLEHPKDGRTDGKEGALVVTGLKLQEDGVVWGKAELLDTPNGKILQEYTRKNVRWGVSSRGNGTVGEDGRVNENDFVVETWDAVMRPSTPGAYPKLSSPAATGSKTKTTESADNALGEMTEDAKACYAQVESAVSKDVQSLSESDLAGFTVDLLAKLGQVDALAKSEAMPNSIAYDVRGWLTKKLGECLEVKQAKLVESQIDEVTSPAAGGETKRKEAFGRVIESVHRRLADSVEECKNLRTQLHEATAKVEDKDAKLLELQKALDESVAERNSLQAKLDVASDTIARLSKTSVLNPVAEAIEEAIKEIPKLEEHREALSKAKDRGELDSLLEGLLPTVLAREPEAPAKPLLEATEPKKRSSLPRGVVISEGVTSQQRDIVAATGNVRLAAKAVAQMGQPKP